MGVLDLPGSTGRFSKRGSITHGGRRYKEWTDEGTETDRAMTGSFTVGSPTRTSDERLQRRTAAILVQRWYRRQLLKFATFGPIIFTRRDGKLADFGSLSFLGGSRTAYFIRLSDTTSSMMLSHFLEKYWRLPRPDVLISVTGSAASLHLTSQLQRVFDRGLASAAAMTNAWIFTGGTDSGVMKLVGEAMHKYGLVDVPIVGIAPWGAIHGRKQLEKCKGENLEVTLGKTGVDSVGRLNPYHTHQILVDAPEASDGTYWGSEIALRSRLERTYATSKGVPVVQLVIQGGLGTLDTVLASAELGTPLIILSDSGGAASALAQYMANDSVTGMPVGIEGVESADFIAQEPKLRALRELHEERGGTLLSFFRLQDEDSQQNMSSAILGALFRNLMFHQAGDAVSTSITPAMQRLEKRRSQELDGAQMVRAATEEVFKRYLDQMQRALLLTVKWNQPGFARRILVDLPPSHDHTRPMRKMLQHALGQRRLEIVKLLLERPGTAIAAVNLCQLYLLEDPYNFLRGDLALQSRLSRDLSEIARDGNSQASWGASYLLFKGIVGPTLHDVSPLLGGIIEHQKLASHADVFFWCVFMGDVRLARELWSHVDHPLHCALLASHVLRIIASRSSAARVEALAAAAEIETWAIGVMDEIHEQELGHWLLSQNVSVWGLGSLIDLGLQMELKGFLAHRHCQSLMDLRWRGGFPGSGCIVSASHSMPLISMWALLLPWCNPYLRRDEEGKSGERAAAFQRKQSGQTEEDDEDEGLLVAEEDPELLLGALAEALNLKEYEKHNAVAALQVEEDKAKAEAEAARARAKAAWAAERAAQDAMSGANAPPANQRPEKKSVTVMVTDDRRDVGSGGSIAKSTALAVSLRAVSLRRQETQTSLGSRKFKHQRTFNQSVKSLVNQGFREEPRKERLRPKSGFYSVPLVKYCMRAVSHVLYLCLYAEVLTHLLTVEQLYSILPRMPPLTLAEFLLIVWSITLGYEHRQRDYMMRAYGLHAGSWLKSLVNTAHLVMNVAIGLRLVTFLPGVELPAAYTAYQTLISFDAVLMCCETFTFMWTSHNFGILAITLVQMMIDLSLFLVFFSVIIVGFCFALVGLSETAPGNSPHQHLLSEAAAAAAAAASAAATEQLSGLLSGAATAASGQIASSHLPGSEFAAAAAANFGSAAANLGADTAGRRLNTFGDASELSAGSTELALYWQPFWAMFAEFELDQLRQVPFGLPLMWVYVLIANVVLVNMLIAMFAETYTRIKQNAETEYRFQHYLHIFEYQHVVHHLPPPFNAPLLFWDACRACFRGTEERERLVRMDFDVYPEDADLYGAGPRLQGAGPQGAQPLSRKYVQRYLKSNSEVTAQTSQASLVRHIERAVSEMEERMQHEFEHMTNALQAQRDETGRKFKWIAAAMDRISRGERASGAASNAQAMKEAMRAGVGAAAGRSQSPAKAPAPPPAMKSQQSVGVEPKKSDRKTPSKQSTARV